MTNTNGTIQYQLKITLINGYDFSYADAELDSALSSSVVYEWNAEL